MRFNSDCVRDILLTIENNTPGINSSVVITRENYIKYELLAKYDYDEIAYHLQQCNLNEYFQQFFVNLDNEFTIIDLTPIAHELLDNVRDNTTWGKVKRAIKNGQADIPLSFLPVFVQNIIYNLTE